MYQHHTHTHTHIPTAPTVHGFKPGTKHTHTYTHTCAHTYLRARAQRQVHRNAGALDPLLALLSNFSSPQHVSLLRNVLSPSCVRVCDARVRERVWSTRKRRSMQWRSQKHGPAIRERGGGGSTDLRDLLTCSSTRSSTCSLTSGTERGRDIGRGGGKGGREGDR